MRRNQLLKSARRLWIGLALAALASPLLLLPFVRALNAGLRTVAAQTPQPQSTGSFLPVTAVEPAAPAATPPQSNQRRITDLMGSNGWPGSDDEIGVWKRMGLRWGRDSAGPGQANSPDSPMDVSKSGPGTMDLARIILRNNRNGIKSLIYLGYTPGWNALVAGDSFSAPRNVSYWEKYVEAVVKKYSAPPYNVKYFQIWNEACGEMSSGLHEATFWHGPGHRKDPEESAPYPRAMQDYVNRVHIPAARIIRKYHAYIVYGGWPDQGGLNNYFAWLEYYSPEQDAKMIDWVDYLDIHYLGVDDLETLYQRYGASDKVRGLWQTEIGDAYLHNQNYLPEYYFDLAVWAMKRNWNDPNKYVSLVYHWDGQLTQRGNPPAYTPSGRALITLRTNVSGVLAPFDHQVKFSPGLSGKALYSDSKIVFQVTGAKGRKSLDVTDLSAPSSHRFKAVYIDAVEGTAIPDANLFSYWQGTTLSLQFNVPGPKKDLDGKPQDHLGYLLVTPLP
jgi:hypothetical protein